MDRNTPAGEFVTQTSAVDDDLRVSTTINIWTLIKCSLQSNNFLWSKIIVSTYYLSPDRCTNILELIGIKQLAEMPLCTQVFDT